MNNFLHKTNFLPIWSHPPLFWASKMFHISNFMLLCLARVFHCLWIQRLLKKFTAWSTRFNINRIYIILSTCNFYINFLPFVCVSTCSVQLLLSISRTQLFHKFYDYIQGLILFLIRSAQLIYFLGKTFVLILQIVTIWNIIPPNIFQVLEKEWKFEVLHVWPNHILSHNIMISQYHLFTITEFWFHFIIFPSLHFTIVPLHHLIYIVIFKLTFTPCSFFRVVPWPYLLIISKYLN